MKKILFAISCLFVFAFASAQATQDDIIYIQAAYGKSKRDLMEQYMKFKDNATTNSFWKLYDSYEVERKKLGQDYIQIIQEYAKEYSSLNDDKADHLVTKVAANNLNFEKLYGQYYDKMKIAVGALKASQFLQIESYLRSEVKMTILYQIPFIGEIDRSQLHVSGK